jgi:hypothetical protein
MTAVTPTYGLTYTTGTDQLCDGADILAQLEQDVADALDTISADVSRLTVIPYAIVSGYNVVENGIVYDGSLVQPTVNIRYDAVEADTANMVDLGTAPDTVFWNPNTNTTGVWMAGFGTSYVSNHLTYNYGRIIDENNDNTQTTARIGDAMLAAATPQTNTFTLNGLYALLSTTSSAALVTQFLPLFDGTAGGHVEAVQPHMWVFWMRDPA